MAIKDKTVNAKGNKGISLNSQEVGRGEETAAAAAALQVLNRKSCRNCLKSAHVASQQQQQRKMKLKRKKL